MSDQQPPAKRPAKGNPRHSGWFVTLNNPSDHPIDLMNIFNMLDPEANLLARYIRVAHEVGEQGTPHLHCALMLHNRMTKKSLMAYLPKSDLRPLIDWRASLTYLAKDGQYLESGIQPAQGVRTDLSNASAAALAGVRALPFVMGANPNLQGFHMYRAVRKLVPPPRRDNICVVWLYGPTGSGKSHWVDQLEREFGLTAYRHSDESGKFLDGYDAEEWSLFDDISPAFDRKQLLKILDKYPLRVATKGSSAPFLSTVIFLTSDRHPTDWIGDGTTEYNKYSIADADQLCRRITFWGDTGGSSAEDGFRRPSFFTRTPRNGPRIPVDADTVIQRVRDATSNSEPYVPRGPRLVKYGGPGGDDLEHLRDLANDPDLL